MTQTETLLEINTNGLGFPWMLAAGGATLLSALGLDVFRQKEKGSQTAAELDCIERRIAEGLLPRDAARVCRGSSISDLANDLKPLLVLGGIGFGLYLLLKEGDKNES